MHYHFAQPHKEFELYFAAPRCTVAKERFVDDIISHKIILVVSRRLVLLSHVFV